MYKLKSIAQRSMMLGAAAMLVTASLPPLEVFAFNELNPLTERSLLLSSSAPGYIDTDGSGNTTNSPNPTTAAYAPAGSGANGKKTGQTFSFKVSTDSVTASRPIKAFSFQYCTTAAGNCFAPGTNTGDDRTETRELNAVAHTNKRSDFDVVGALGFTISHNGTPIDTTDWTFAADNEEDVIGGSTPAERTTGTNNYITLVSPTGVSPAFDDEIKIVFEATEATYITNPGGEKFFVKINTFDSDTVQNLETTRIDGGVTVANMMTDSIHITTKVLETMSFSVGIGLPEQADGSSFNPCTPIDVIGNNRINLGNPNAENSLETDRAHEQKSYWRIQSNSSGGATIYYSGDTLRNTVGDEIQPMSQTKIVPLNADFTPDYNGYGDPAFTVSSPASEQFGLALVEAKNTSMDDGGDVSEDYIAAQLVDNRLRDLTISPLSAVGGYSLTGGEGNAKTFPGADAGTWLDAIGGNLVTDFAEYGFTPRSVEVPEPIAQGTSVLSCTTGKMRYVGNIAADTPAGVYTTKINYLAAPKY